MLRLVCSSSSVQDKLEALINTFIRVVQLSTSFFSNNFPHIQLGDDRMRDVSSDEGSCAEMCMRNAQSCSELHLGWIGCPVVALFIAT